MMRRTKHGDNRASDFALRPESFYDVAIETDFKIMTNTDPVPHRKNPVRAMMKIAVIMLALLALCGLAAVAIDDPVLDEIKFNLSLGSLIILVVVINIISLIVFVIMFAAYQWVRCDLKAPRSEDVAEDSMG